MPSTRPATLRAEELPDVCTASEIAAFERVDVRVIRADLNAGRVPGAYRRGAHWRINRDAYLDTIAGSRHE